MRNRFDRQLEELNEMLIHMGELCETAIEEATGALEGHDIARAKAVITADSEIDQMEKEIEKNIELKNVYKEKRTAHYDIRPYEDLRSDESGRCANVYDISITSAIPLILNHIHTQTDQVED